MKKVNKIFIVFFFVIYLFTNCKKEEQLSLSQEYYLKNETTDTLVCKINIEAININGDLLLLQNNYIINSNEYKKIFAGNMFSENHKIKSVFIYKLKDTLNVFIKFEYGQNPLNYKVDFFNIENWEKIEYVKDYHYEHNYTRYCAYRNYYFHIDTSNIIIKQ